MGRGTSPDQASGLLYGPLTTRPMAADRRQVGSPLDDLRQRLTSEIRLSRSDIHHIALALKVDVELGTVTQTNFDRILDEIAAQMSGLGRSALLDDAWGDSVKRRLDVRLAASDWQAALESVGRSAGHDVDDDVAVRCWIAFDYLSGGREPEELGSPWPCEWGECDFVGEVGEMVYYNGSGMAGFLCAPCAAEQIVSDRP